MRRFEGNLMERSKDPIDRTGLAAALVRRACLLASSWRPVQRLGRAVSAGQRPRRAALGALCGACAVLLAAPLAIVTLIGPAAQARPAGNMASGARSASGAWSASGARSASAARTDDAGDSAPTVNWALSGTATATTAESGQPAANAIDGDAGTDWCTSGYTGTLTVDLGQVRSLADLGLTLDAASPSASATIELASTAGAWQQVPAAARRRARPG